ncbi:MAG: hypothetical protein ABI255_11630 [Microbacteriaceae bacterium]
MNINDPHETHQRTAANGTWLDDAASATLQHKGGVYQILPLDAVSWVIRSADGRTMGSLILLASEGESGDPVYAGRLPEELDNYSEGSDWRGIAKAIINAAS